MSTTDLARIYRDYIDSLNRASPPVSGLEKPCDDDEDYAGDRAFIRNS